MKKKKVNEAVRKKTYKQLANLHPALDSVRTNKYNALTVVYEGSGSDDDRDVIIVVDTKGDFDR